jgi:DNA-binding SARP family transcriptional activator/Tfp pilus assembly protein PilF
MNELLQVSLLSEFAVSNAQGIGVKFHSKLERSLVAYLGFYQQSHDRDQLANVFWALERSGAGRKNLSQLMWRVSQSIGQDVFLADRDSVQLEPFKLLVDLNMLRQQLARIGDQHDPSVIQGFITASQKELLKGFFDDWVFEARDQWQVELNAGLQKLEHLAEIAGAFEDVIALARAQIRLEPLNERANTSVIRTCLVLGRSSEARDHFEQFRSALADIGEVVSGKMRVLGERIQSGQSRSNISARGSLEVGAGLRMVGRSVERERCLKAIGEAKLGTGRIVLIEGESGIGKTKLIQSLIDDATWRGQNVLRATAQELRQLEPYRVIQEMLSDNLGSLRLEVLKNQLAQVWLQEAARVIPKLGGAQNAIVTLQDPERLRESLIEVFKTLARVQPLAIFVDDLQWTDEASLLLMLGLGRILESLPIALVIGFRSLEARERPSVWRCIETLDRHAFTTRVQLEALKKEKIKEMAQKALGITLLPEVVTHLEQVTQGNPMFVLETLKVLLETGIALEDQSLWMSRVKTMPLATGLREVIVSRLSRLEAKTREVIQLAAVIGARFEFELLQGLTQIPTVELLDILDALIQSGFLQEIEPGFGFAHDQLRQTIYEQIAEGECTLLHGQVLQHLETRGSIAPEVLASHAERAKQFGLAKRYRLKSAEHSLALHSYQQALLDLQAIGDLAQTNFDAEEQIRFLETRIRADSAQNGFERMLHDMTSLDALLEHQPSKRLEVTCRRAKTLATIGRSPEALEILDQAQLESLNGDAFDQVQVLIAKGGVFLAGGGPFDLALEPLIQAVQLCVDHRLKLEAEARANLGLAYTQLARFTDALSEYQTALRLAELEGDSYREALTLGRIAACLCSQGYDHEAIPYLERAITQTHKLGLRLEEAKNLSNLGFFQYRIGNVTKGLELYDQALALSKAIGAKFSEAHILAATAFLKYLHSNPELARQQLQAALEINQELGDLAGQGFVLSQLGLLHHWGGQLERANDLLLEAKNVQFSSKDVTGEMSALIWLVENMILQERLIEARVLIKEGQEQSKLHQLPNEEMQFGRLIATTQFLNGHPRVALELLQECLPDSGEYQGIEIDGFYRFHLLHYKILNAIDEPENALMTLQKAYQFAQIELQSYPASERPGWRKAIPVVNEILSLYEQYLEHKVSVRLASKDAPTGRGLQEHEFLDVDWVVHKPEDDQILDKTKRRQHQLERLCKQALEQGALPTVEDLANALNTSVATVKRDLAALRAANVHLATRGARVSA